MSFRIDDWLEARERFLGKIDDEQKILFQSATLENLFHIYNISAPNHKTQYHDGGGSNVAAKKLQSLVTAIEYFGSIIDAPPSVVPLILQTILGGIRALLYTSSRFRKYYSKLINVLKTLGEMLLKINAYERLFPTHKHAADYIPLIYLDFFDYCAQANATFRATRITDDAPDINEIRRKYERGGNDQSLRRMRLHMERFKVEASLTYVIGTTTDTEKRRQKIEEKECERHLIILEQEKISREMTTRSGEMVLRELSECQPKWKHQRLQKERGAGTCRWITLTNEFRSWLIYPECTSCVWLTGIAGSGKTILTSAVIDEIRSQHLSGGWRLAFFYCDYENSQTLQPREIIGSLIQQLRNNLRLPHYGLPIDERVQELYKNDRVPTIQELSDLFMELVAGAPSPSGAIFIVIDGLDECKEKDRELIMPWLVKLGKQHRRVKLFVSSRVKDDIRKSLRGPNWLSITINPESISNDIAMVAENTIKTKIKREKFCVRDSNLLQEIIDRLVEKGKGRFLWIRFQLDDICGETSEDGVRKVLDNLPSDLNETYKRALIDITHQGAHQINLAQRTFRWMVVAKRPLTIDELQEAVAIKPQGKCIDIYEVPDAFQIIRSCGKFIVYDQKDRTLHLAHRTAQQFLVTDASLGELEISRYPKNFHFQLGTAEAEAANICITYLMFKDFEVGSENERALLAQKSEVPDLETTGWIPDISGLIKKAKSDMLVLLRKAGFHRPSVNNSQRFSPYLRPCRETQTKYRFLRYVIDHWVEHTNSLDGGDGMIELFTELLFDRKVSFHFRPWGDSEVGLSGHQLRGNMFRWAVKNDHGHIIATLFALSTKSTGYKPFDSSSLIAILDHPASSYINCLIEDETSLYYAAAMGCDRTLQVFVSDQCQKLFSRYYNTHTIQAAISVALSCGQEQAAILLLKTFAKNPEFELTFAQNRYPKPNKLAISSDKIPYYPLHLAAKSGLEKVASLLLNSFGYNDTIAVNSTDTLAGFNVVHYCAQSGSIGIMKILLKMRLLSISYPEYETTDGKKSTALRIAHQFQPEIVDFLLRLGAPLDKTAKPKDARCYAPCPPER